MHVECGCAVFGKHSKFSTMHCRKCKFVLIDVEVGLLLGFLVIMKAKVHVHMYQKYVTVFSVFTREKLVIFKYPFPKSLVWSPDFKVLVSHVYFHHFRLNGWAKRL